MFGTPQEFEDEVRRVARLLWPTAQYGGAAIEDGRERDGIFETDEFVHVIECTMLRTKEKASTDGVKIAKLLRKYAFRYPTKFLKGWFITLAEPTADQRNVLKETATREKLQAAQLVAVSFDQFRAQLVDARSYLQAREKYPFGSARDPLTGDANLQFEYVPLVVLDGEGGEYDTALIEASLLGGKAFALLGDYGAGKSVTLRELYRALAKAFWSSRSVSFPVLLNLRDHHGQVDPVEALERHARRIGFPNPASLVRAWRGGFATLLLDGFDEIAAAGWAGKTKTLKELRYRSMELVRTFIRESPSNSGLIVAGRAHFFDSDGEMMKALGMRATAKTLVVAEFNDSQVAEFLRRAGWDAPIPEWLPSRPLLLSYLASRKLLSPRVMADDGQDPAAGWDSMLQRICEREAELEAGVDPETVRRLVEQVATIARSSVDGLGPVSPDAAMQAFRDVCGYPPDDRGAVLLQRLPGLGAHHSEDGSRVFIDQDFVEAARGGVLFRTIENPFVFPFDSETWQSTVQPLGAQLAALRVAAAGFSAGKLAAAARHLAASEKTHTAACDVLLVMLECGMSWGADPLFLREVIVPLLPLDDPDTTLTHVEFQDAVIGLLSLGPAFPASGVPRFVRTHLGRIDGRTGEKDLPMQQFEECEFGAFEQVASTTNAILGLSLPLGTKVMLTVLKKLYAQGGAGRKESALYRGLDSRAQLLVPAVLVLLRKEGLVARATRGTQPVWLPTRTQDSRKRALGMLAAPNGSADPALTGSRGLG